METGWKPNQSLFDYIKSPGVHRTFLTELIDKSEGHAEFKKNHPETTDSLRVGDATHAAVLEPERFKTDYVILPQNCRPGTKANPNPGCNARKAEFLAIAESKGQTVISDADNQNIREMAAVVHGNQHAMDLLSDGVSELSGYFIDPDYGVLVKFRLDWINKKTRIMPDLKTCNDARKYLFRKSAYDHGYDMQSWISCYGTTQLTGITHDDFRFICVENKQGKYHGLKIYEADQEMLDIGRARYCEAMERYVRCLDSGIWDGYDSTSEPLGAPGYMRDRYLTDNGV